MLSLCFAVPNEDTNLTACIQYFRNFFSNPV